MRSENVRRRPVYRPAACPAARTGSSSIPPPIYLLFILTRGVLRLVNGTGSSGERLLGRSSGISAGLWAWFAYKPTGRDPAFPASLFHHTP